MIVPQHRAQIITGKRCRRPPETDQGFGGVLTAPSGALSDTRSLTFQSETLRFATGVTPSELRITARVGTGFGEGSASACWEGGNAGSAGFTS